MKTSLKLLLSKYMYFYDDIFNVCAPTDCIVLCKLVITFLVYLFYILILLLMNICVQNV
jgi:hypothetical protein